MALTPEQLQSAVKLRAYIRRCRVALMDAAASGASSASVSTGGNSQSYTRYSLADLEALIAQLERQYRYLISGRSGGRRTSPDFR